MSRDTEHKFIDINSENLTNDLISSYENICGTAVTPASPEMLFIKWLSGILLQLYAQANYIGNQNLPSRADGNNLDIIGNDIFNLPRPAAKQATCTVRFNISTAQDVLVFIPSNTRITDESRSLVWETTEDAYIDIGQTSVDVTARCQTAGIEANGYAIGKINTIIDLYDYASSCSNITASSGGSDEATDDEYYELMKLSGNGYSCAGSKGGYIYFAKNVSTNIADVVVNNPDTGTVALYVLMNDGTLAPKEIKDSVLKACSSDNVRPLTDCVTVADGQAVQYNIKFTYYVQNDIGKSSDEISADVSAAVNNYVAWQSGKFGRDINPDKLREQLYAAGVKRLELTSPSFQKLTDGSDNAAPQIAKINEITILNGGYEDE